MTILTTTLERTARTEPDRVAVRDHGRAVTFAELERMSVRLSAWLARQGLVPGDVVGLTVRGGLRHLAATFALMRLGCAHVQLASHEAAGMRTALAHRCRAKAVIGDLPEAALDGIALIAPDFDAVFEDASLQRDAPACAATEDAVVILTSSGTTGRPKLVACSQRQLHGYGQPEIPDAPVVFLHYSIESNAAKWISMTNLAHGRTMVFEDAERMSLAEICARNRVDRVNAFPAKLETLAREAACATPAERAVLSRVHFLTGGSGVGGELRRATREHLSPLLHVMYGATECGVISVAGPESHAERPDSVGPPFPGVEVRIVDEDGRPLPAGETGLIRIRSPWSATAYVDDEEASARMFRDGWFQPGDMGALAPDGWLSVAGRGDDMMILNSINIFPAEIETVAQQFRGVVECAAFARRGTPWGDIPLLAVVGPPTLDTGALLAWCRARLGPRAPRKVIRLEAIPRNTLGKVLRRELERQDSDPA